MHLSTSMRLKKWLGSWTFFEAIWLVSFSSLAIALSIVWGDNLLGLAVFLTGVLCVVLTAKGRVEAYVFGMVNTLGYAWLAFGNHLFGEMGLNLFFFVPTNIIGFILWRRNIQQNDHLTMRRMSWNSTILVLSLSLACIALGGLGLSLIPGQNTPYIDAATNVLSIAATLLTMGRFREQWLLYMVLNVFTVIMWALRTAAGSPDGPLMVLMWSAYLVNAGYGYYNWSKGARLDASAAVQNSLSEGESKCPQMTKRMDA